MKSCIDCKHCKPIPNEDWPKYDASKYCATENIVLYDYDYADDCSAYKPRKEKSNAL